MVKWDHFGRPPMVLRLFRLKRTPQPAPGPGSPAAPANAEPTRVPPPDLHAKSVRKGKAKPAKKPARKTSAKPAKKAGKKKR